MCYPTLTGIRPSVCPVETPSSPPLNCSGKSSCSPSQHSSYEAACLARGKPSNSLMHCDPASAASQENVNARPLSLTLKIGVTQPRRVAAVMVSRRVGEELGNPRLVGYHVSYYFGGIVTCPQARYRGRRRCVCRWSEDWRNFRVPGSAAVEPVSVHGLDVYESWRKAVGTRIKYQSGHWSRVRIQALSSKQRIAFLLRTHSCFVSPALLLVHTVLNADSLAHAQ